MSFANWKDWKMWQWVGMLAFGILLIFLYFTNRSMFDEKSKELREKFQGKQDDLDNQQKADAVKKAEGNATSIQEAEKKLQDTAVKYNNDVAEAKKKGDTDEKVAGFNDYMGN